MDSSVRRIIHSHKVATTRIHIWRVVTNVVGFVVYPLQICGPQSVLYMSDFFRALAVMAALSVIRWDIGPLRQEEYSWDP